MAHILRAPSMQHWQTTELCRLKHSQHSPRLFFSCCCSCSAAPACLLACRSAQVWKIKRFTGASEHSLRAEVTMVSTTKERKPWARPPISMNFQVGAGHHAAKVHHIYRLSRCFLSFRAPLGCFCSQPLLHRLPTPYCIASVFHQALAIG